ncbi:MAG: aspartate--tRNA(Asn) ligase [Candidatus Curtissbacteria bacterium]|nr:aspartate--tRNA(Asn) ligase [Candidatus Curtissbacteria bacterium]
MQRTIIADCPKKVGEKVEIYGWVDTKRDHGKITFIDIHDFSGQIQVVGSGEDLSALKPQYVVKVEGVVQKRPPEMVNEKLKTGEVEIKIDKVEVLSKADELPFDLGMGTLDLELPTLLDFRALTLRHPKVKAIFKVQAKVLEGFRKAAEEIGCTEIIVPTIAASQTEGGAEVFKVDYYGHKAFLTQSPQLYKQILIPVFERVFTVTKAYRAEPSVTTRHLSEVTQMDCEIGFVQFTDLLDLLEKVAVETIKYAESECEEILDSLGHKKIAFGKIPRLTLREAQEIIKKEYGRDNTKEKDLTPQDEQDLCKWALEKHKSDLVTVTHFPTAAKPFYTKPDPENPKLSLSYDLLFRGVEVLSGSQRIEGYDQLVESIKSRGMNPKDFEMYLMAFKFGMPPEGGFSFGLERITMHILNLANIREASLFPRDMERVDIRFSKLVK